jgi:hypothetical protein
MSSANGKYFCVIIELIGILTFGFQCMDPFSSVENDICLFIFQVNPSSQSFEMWFAYDTNALALGVLIFLHLHTTDMYPTLFR